VTIEGPLPRVLGEKARLGQVVSNLVNNAVKFARPEIPARVRIYHQERAGRIRLCVEDNGIGIEPEYHRRIFQPFERLHPRDGHEGTGIGLAIVRKAVERMGGSVGVESDGKTGSCFWFELSAVPR
jgi:signal transduction histidine kinase